MCLPHTWLTQGDPFYAYLLNNEHTGRKITTCFDRVTSTFKVLLLIPALNVGVTGSAYMYFGQSFIVILLDLFSILFSG